MSETVFICRRRWYTDKSTISEVFVNDAAQRLCFVLEDKARIRKVPNETAIPSGRYEIVLSYSNRFGRLTPLLLNVAGYEGIRIHPGNSARDTSGCPLPGDRRGVDVVEFSRVAYTNIYGLILNGLREGKCVWDVIDDPFEDRRSTLL